MDTRAVRVSTIARVKQGKKYGHIIAEQLRRPELAPGSSSRDKRLAALGTKGFLERGFAVVGDALPKKILRILEDGHLEVEGLSFPVCPASDRVWPAG